MLACQVTVVVLIVLSIRERRVEQRRHDEQIESVIAQLDKWLTDLKREADQ